MNNRPYQKRDELNIPVAVDWHSIVFQVTFEWPRISINRLIISAPSDTSLTFNYQGLEIKIF